MTNNERELVNLIRGNENPEQAFRIAVAIICGFVAQHVSSQAPSADSRMELL